MKTLLPFLIFFPIILQSQESPRAAMGIYGGIGISNFNKSIPGLAYEIGQSTIVSAKKKKKLRIEIFFQYTNGTFHGDSRKRHFSQMDSTYSMSHYKIDFLNAGLKWHIPIVYRSKYKLFLTPGFILGGINKSHYVRKRYRFSDNSLVSVGDYDGYVSTRFVFGPTICIAQEFRLSEWMCLNVSLNGFIQSTVEFEARGPWSVCSLRTGLYWYIKTKRPARTVADKEE